jgi:predicted permease
MSTRGRRYRELAESMREHLAERVEDLVGEGMSRRDAEFQARREFGNVTRIEEQSREVWQWPRVESLWADVKFALRQMRRRPGFAAVVMVTLALGIGANTAVFTLVYGILMRSLPVADPGQLVRIGDRDTCCYWDSVQSADGDFDLFSYDACEQMKEGAPEFEQLAVVQAGGESFSARRGSRPSVPMRAEYVSGNYFTTLGVGASAGRPLSESDDQAGAAPVLVLSYQAWQTLFGSDPGVVGSTVNVDGHAFTVAGIAPAGFFGDRVAPFPADAWLPLATEPVMEGANSALLDKDEDWLYPLGRLRAGVNRRALEAKLSGVLRRWLYSRPRYAARGGAALIPKQHVVLADAGGGIQKLQQQTGKGLRMLIVLSAVVLLIACANVASLLLARSATRRGEIAARMALGAGRVRVVRQMLTESVLLSGFGGAAGLVVAYLGSHAMLKLAFPAAKHVTVGASPSWPVLAFALGVSLVTGIAFGVAPAWASAQAVPAEALRGAGRATRDRSSTPQRVLVVLQVAWSVVLLAGAFATTKSLSNLEDQDFGIVTANRYVVQFDPKAAGYSTAQLPALYREIEDRFGALPGATHVSLARYLPLGGNMWGSCVIREGGTQPGPADHCFSMWDRVGAGFLDTLGVPVMRGRGFTADDTQSSRAVALVNESLARQFFPGEDPIGQHFGVNLAQDSGRLEIVGVFPDFTMANSHGDNRPLFLRPATQQMSGLGSAGQDAGEASSMYLGCLVTAFAHPVPDAENLMRKTLASIDPNLTVFGFQTYDAQVAANFTQERLLARLTLAFGGLALVLASVGIYGVMSYFVARRRSEIGVRMALGATRASAVAMVMRGAGLQVLAGLALGIPAALYGGRLVESLLYKVSGYDPVALVVAVMLLGVSAALASGVPAMRAASVNPMEALRSE